VEKYKGAFSDIKPTDCDDDDCVVEATATFGYEWFQSAGMKSKREKRVDTQRQDGVYGTIRFRQVSQSFRFAI
jgi:hypothetical protein